MSVSCPPVLLLVFNRPENTRQVIEAIRAARPEKLYVSADGPRTDHPGEQGVCDEARKIATAVDWPCEVKANFSDSNLGCKAGVSRGITWFFEHEPEGIILEDDTVPNLSFFQFCSELLERYRDDERVMSISGMNSHPEPLKTEYSYYFSRYSLMWGWASWRRAWNKYDGDMKQWPELRNSDWLFTVGDGSYPFKKWWEAHLNDCYNGLIDTWDFQWIYSCWLHSGLSIHPTVNMVRNRGFGRDATHTKREEDYRKDLIVREMEFPLKHPDYINRSYRMDRYLDRHWFEISWYREAKKSLRKYSWIRNSAAVKRRIVQAVKKQ